MPSKYTHKEASFTDNREKGKGKGVIFGNKKNLCLAVKVAVVGLRSSSNRYVKEATGFCPFQGGKYILSPKTVFKDKNKCRR